MYMVATLWRLPKLPFFFLEKSSIQIGLFTRVLPISGAYTAQSYGLCTKDRRFYVYILTPTLAFVAPSRSNESCHYTQTDIDLYILFGSVYQNIEHCRVLVYNVSYIHISSLSYRTYSKSLSSQ